MTSDQIVRELAALEAALSNRIVIVREILEPIDTPGGDAPTGWRVAKRIYRGFFVEQQPEEKK